MSPRHRANCLILAASMALCVLLIALVSTPRIPLRRAVPPLVPQSEYLLNLPLDDPAVGPAAYRWGVIGNAFIDPPSLRATGVRLWIVRVSWREYAPGIAAHDLAYIGAKRAEFDRLRESGFQLILDPGFHDTPQWLHGRYPDSQYIDQDGQPYIGGDQIDSGNANFVFNPALRDVLDRYLADLFASFGTDFAAVRLGGGRSNELAFPPSAPGRAQYWAFDRYALARSPTPRWRPGQPSPQGEAEQFLSWYLDCLAEYQNWQIATVRRYYDGPVMILYPGWGIRPGQESAAITANLAGTTAAEKTGEIPAGTDYARQIAALHAPNVILTTTWLDARDGSDFSPDPRQWRPVKYIAALASASGQQFKLYGENTGQGDVGALHFAAEQMVKFHLLGFAWYREEELYSGRYATVADLRSMIGHTVP